MMRALGVTFAALIGAVLGIVYVFPQIIGYSVLAWFLYKATWGRYRKAQHGRYG